MTKRGVIDSLLNLSHPPSTYYDVFYCALNVYASPTQLLLKNISMMP